MYVKCNVTKKEEVEEMVNKTVEKFGKLDCLVNNAGVNRPRMLVDYYHSDPNHENSEDDFDFMMGVNVKGCYVLCTGSSKNYDQTKKWSNLKYEF